MPRALRMERTFCFIVGPFVSGSCLSPVIFHDFLVGSEEVQCLPQRSRSSTAGPRYENRLVSVRSTNACLNERAASVRGPQVSALFSDPPS